jgi:hypothetical protein
MHLTQGEYKMKTKLTTPVLFLVFCISILQAAEIRWASDNMPDFYLSADPDAVNWELADNWFNVTNVLAGTAPYWTVPTAGDIVYIDSEANPGVVNETMPYLSSNVDNINILHLGHYFPGDSSLTLLPIPGADINITQVRLGNYIGSTGTLNIQGGTLVTNQMEIGFNSAVSSAGGNGIINMSGNSVLHMASIVFGQQNSDYDPSDPDLSGTGYIYMTEDARLIVNGDQTTILNEAISSGWIQAVHPCESLELVYNYNGTDISSTEVNVVKAVTYSDMDFNYDCIVDETDFISFVEQWLDDKN